MRPDEPTDASVRDEPELPSDLGAELSQLWRADRVGQAELTELDRGVLTAARRQLWRRRAAAVLLTPGKQHVAAAAAILALVLGVRFLDEPDATDPFDVDGSGRVDIVDAYVLARRVEDGRAGDWDVNGDGNVDTRDVDMISERVVRLDG